MSNMYLASAGDVTFVIDPSVAPDSLPSVPEAVTAILITHGHYDHIKCVEEWHNKFPEDPIYMSSADKDLIRDPVANCSYMDMARKTFEFPYLVPEGTIRAGDMEIGVITTPGHTMGSLCYMFTDEDKHYLFTGDTVFSGSVGRTDMPGGNFALLKRSIGELCKLDPDTVILPGHGPESTIGAEMDSNPFFEI